MTWESTETKRDEICWRSGCKGGLARRSDARVNRGYGVYHREPIDNVVAHFGFCDGGVTVSPFALGS